MTGALGRLRAWLFGTSPRPLRSARRQAAALIGRIAEGGLRALRDDELMDLVDLLLEHPEFRVPLRGNVRFLDSVSRQYAAKQRITQKQRSAIHNVLERAYPHNLAVELRYL
jgi:hypothetical protein